MTHRAPIAALALTLAGCSGDAAESDHDHDHDHDTDPVVDTGTLPEDTGPIATPGDIVEQTLDASDPEAWVYLDLASRTVLDQAAAAGGDWHLAVRRSEIRTNGGTSGDGTVTSGLAVPQDDFYDADGQPLPDVFLAATADDELEHLTASFDGPEMVSDAILGPFGEDWFHYDVATGDATAADDVGWLVRSGEGTSYARVRVTALDFPTREGTGIQSFTVEVERDTGTGLTAPVLFEGSVPGAGGSVCFDWDTAATIDCADPAWDLELGFEGFTTFLYTNSGDAGDGDGGAIGPADWAELSTYTTATEDLQGNDLTGWFMPDVSTSAFGVDLWYAYNLQGMHRLYPNFRTYLVDTGSTEYAVQVLDYYDDASASGHLTLRWVER